VNRGRGDLVQSLGIEPFRPPGGQGLEDEVAHVLRGSWLWLGPSNTDLPAAEAPEVPREIRNGLDLSMKGSRQRNEGPLSCHDLAAAPISVHDEAKALHRDVAANVGDGHPKAVATRRDLHSLHVEPVNR